METARRAWEPQPKTSEVSWRLYRNDPNWIPPLRIDQEELVGYRAHPFYDRNEARTFLAYRGGEPCGRIAAILNHHHNEHYRERRGFWGFFECIDDQEAACALFDAVREWFAARDIHALRGPMNPALRYGLGVLTDGFDSPPTFLMPYNPSYYPRLIEAYGFHKAQDLFAYYGHRDQLPASTERFHPISEQIIQRYNIRLRTLGRKWFRRDVEEFVSIYNRTLPDYNPRIRQIDGRLFPFGFLRLLRNKQAIKKVRVAAVYVVPEYRLHGVGLVLLRALVPKALEWGMQESEYSWVAESNHLSRGALEKGGATRIKSYRVYDWP